MRDAKEEAERQRKVHAKLAIAAAMRSTIRTKNPVAHPDCAFDMESADAQNKTPSAFDLERGDTEVEDPSAQQQSFEDEK